MQACKRRVADEEEDEIGTTTKKPESPLMGESGRESRRGGESTSVRVRARARAMIRVAA